METVRCNICGGNEFEEALLTKDFEIITTKGSLNIDVRNVVCKTCGLVFQNPRFDEDEAKFFYTNQFRDEINSNDKVNGAWIRIQQKDFLINNLPAGRIGRILDIGCYEGYFLHLLENMGWEPYGIEPSVSSVKIARERYGLEVFCGIFEESNFMEEFFDVISIRNVLEHIRDPKYFLQLACSKLKPFGYLFIEVPNLYKPFTTDLNDFFSFQHLYHFSPVTLRNLLDKVGFKIIYQEECSYPALRILATKDENVPGIRYENDYAAAVEIIRRYQVNRVENIELINSRIRQFATRLSNKKVLLYGAGFNTEFLLNNCDLTELDIVGLSDKNGEKHGQTIFGYKVYRPDEVINLEIGAVIISSYKFQEEIYDEILFYEDYGIHVIKLYDNVIWLESVK